MTHRHGILIVGLIVFAAGLGVASTARAQAPFFAASGTSFTPEIGVVSSGVINDVQAVVSSDRKHVTLTMRPQQSALLSIENFTFQNGGSVLGFVGQAGGGNAGGNGGRAVRAGGRDARTNDYPDGRPTVRSVLDRVGMFRIDSPQQP